MIMIPGSYFNVYIGNSNENKPTTLVPDASIFYEKDKVRAWMFDADNSEWLLQVKSAEE